MKIKAVTFQKKDDPKMISAEELMKGISEIMQGKIKIKNNIKIKNIIKKEHELLSKTSVYVKTVNYIKELIKDKVFNEKIDKIRGKIIDQIKIDPNFSFEKWNNQDAMDISYEYGLGTMYCDFIVNYIWTFNNKLDYREISETMITVIRAKEVRLLQCRMDVDEYDSLYRCDDILYPVFINISAHATKRDILDYITKMYKTKIKPIQDEYRKDTSLGKFKTKNKKKEERNLFIYNNRKLPNKEIISLVAEKFGEVLDYALIAKIIYLEKEKRN